MNGEYALEALHIHEVDLFEVVDAESHAGDQLPYERSNVKI